MRIEEFDYFWKNEITKAFEVSGAEDAEVSFTDQKVLITVVKIRYIWDSEGDRSIDVAVWGKLRLRGGALQESEQHWKIDYPLWLKNLCSKNAPEGWKR